ncbi:EAL domain-containing protein [Pokkaliibacter sp. MBI-7]|uniref:putative bifunctional diguanylate cyclase/phosphodiesterase n=1 Tax=Pokkaliibacter sp. MBI-7 TaxID=3040600 RepID=UPI00244AB86A|nr:EAL domain-containing protein [Pokkaliibacter sp. MBI-7]MDH2435657.1 EAL domain-containing protein [Pokkaliibacter sp. MBI-7]
MATTETKYRTIRWQLVMLGVRLTALALAILLICTLSYEVLGKRQALLADMQVNASITGRNIAAAIVFGDKGDAQEVLSALEVVPAIRQASVFLPDGQVLGHFARAGDTTCQPLQANGQGWHLSWCSLTLYHPVTLHEQVIGTLALENSLAALYRSLGFDLLFGLLAVIIALAVSHQLWWRFATRLTKPLYQLFQLTQKVEKYQDFSLRADVLPDNEVGQLAHSFNRMMGQLQRHHSRLSEELEQRKLAEFRLNQLAYYDNVTSLHNRHYFKEKLEEVVLQAELQSGSCAVLFIDLDGFKKINDTLGHEAGDDLLRLVAERLQSSVRGHDMVCRLGGDEFAIIIQHQASSSQLEYLGNRLLEVMSPSFNVANTKVFVTASIGACLYPEQAKDKHSLVRYADMAMYQAKEQGKNAYCLYLPGSVDDMDIKFRLEHDLHDAIQQRQLVLEYQPLYGSQSHELFGFEALLRWHHPELGAIAPSEFIGIAEDCGLIIPIGEWVLTEVCTQLTEWQRIKPDLRVSINLSGYQLRNEPAMASLCAILERFALPEGSIELELTEGSLLETTEVMRTRLQQLLRVGFLLAIDDFGTGYSSLSYLHCFPFNRIKVDRSFVSRLNNGRESLALIKAVVAIGEALNMEVIAEGVEDEMQAKLLRDIGCDQMQGYFFSRPVPAMQATQILVARNRSADRERVRSGVGT